MFSNGQIVAEGIVNFGFQDCLLLDISPGEDHLNDDLFILELVPFRSPEHVEPPLALEQEFPSFFIQKDCPEAFYIVYLFIGHPCSQQCFPDQRIGGFQLAKFNAGFRFYQQNIGKPVNDPVAIPFR